MSLDQSPNHSAFEPASKLDFGSNRFAKGCVMAWLEKRGSRFRLTFRFQNSKHATSLKTENKREAEACKHRVEENLRLLERGRITVPEGMDITMFLLSDGRVNKPSEAPKWITLGKLFDLYRESFTNGAKELVTLKTKMPT